MITKTINNHKTYEMPTNDQVGETKFEFVKFLLIKKNTKYEILQNFHM